MPAPFWRKLLWPSLVWCLFFFPLSSSQRQCAVRPHTGKSISEPSSKNEIVIAAVGDVIMPASIHGAAKRHKKGYRVLFEKIAADLAGADIAFANLETPVDDRTDRSGYPQFNANPELLAALKETGVKVVSVANNHAIDEGSEGLRRTLDNIESSGIVFIGAGRSIAETEEIKFVRTGDATVAFLAFSHCTSRQVPGRESCTSLVNIIRTGSEQDLSRAAAAVRRARPYADLVVVSVHWEEEYAVQPSVWQKHAASAIVEAGADIILGHKPHVLQPIVSMTADDGRVALVAFSLGNFISSRRAGSSILSGGHAKALRGDGIILTVTAVKESGSIRVDRAEFLPIWTILEPVGSAMLHRPVSLFREIAALKAKQLKSGTDDELLEFMSFRQDYIIRTIINRPENQYL